MDASKTTRGRSAKAMQRGHANTQVARSDAGFTMAELLTVVAILAILMAIAGILIMNYMRDLTLVEYDNAAKSIYIAAQNNISDLQASGEWGATDGRESKYYASSKSPNQNLHTPTATRTDSSEGGEAADGTSTNGTYFWITASYARDHGILPAGSVDETIRTNDFIIEYCYETATVYGVFYTKGTTGVQDFYTQGTGSSSVDVRSREARRNNNPIIGYYGGADASNLQHATLESPIVSAGRSPVLAVTDPNLANSKLSTVTLVTLKSTTAINDRKVSEGDASITLVLQKNLAGNIVVRYLKGGKSLPIADTGFCSFSGTSIPKTTYSINLTSMKSNSKLSALMANFQAGDEYQVTAKCTSAAVLCQTVYGYGNGVWPSSDDVVFTSNIIADYETEATVWLYHSGSKGDETEPFSINLENYYNADTLANETLFYKIETATDKPNTFIRYEPVVVSSAKKPTSISPDTNGYYKYAENTSTKKPNEDLVFHTLKNIYIEGANSFANGTITITVYRKAETVNNTDVPAAEVAKTLIINVKMMNSKKDWEYEVEDKGSYADVTITAGESPTPSLAISSPSTSVAIADWTNPLATRTSAGTITLKSIPAGCSATVRFLKTSPGTALTKDSFTLNPKEGNYQ